MTLVLGAAGRCIDGLAHRIDCKRFSGVPTRDTRFR
jgi:hypothetical protein